MNLATAKSQVPHPRFAALVRLPIPFQRYVQAGKPALAVDPSVDANSVIEHEGSAGTLHAVAADHGLS